LIFVVVVVMSSFQLVLLFAVAVVAAASAAADLVDTPQSDAAGAQGAAAATSQDDLKAATLDLERNASTMVPEGQQRPTEEFVRFSCMLQCKLKGSVIVFFAAALIRLDFNIAISLLSALLSVGPFILALVAFPFSSRTTPAQLSAAL
jgi:hypothetical protein